jgi:hypothetical protein
MYHKNSKVRWQWLGKNIDGVVEEVFTTKVTRTIKSKKITRNASAENPAYLVRSEAGNLALKLETELKLPEKKKTTARKNSPKMFGT